MTLDDQQLTVLEIAATGEEMLAIGNWEVPIKLLAEFGLMARRGNGYHITAAGMDAYLEQDQVVMPHLTIEGRVEDA